MARVGGLALLAVLSISVATAAVPPPSRLDAEQSARFRSWFTRIVRAQLERGPDPRWTQRDCAGYVRFGVAEALKDHDAKWLRAIGMEPHGLPPEIAVPAESRRRFTEWARLDGARSAYASAIGIVQANARFVGKDVNQARPGDLFFFDQGEDQHLMIWLGTTVAYHTGSPTKNDSGLRAATLPQLMNWKDTRWRPLYDNPNFVGIYRLSFLSP